MSKPSRPPQCVCGNQGRCGYCPRIAATAAREAFAYTDSAGMAAWLAAQTAAAATLAAVRDGWDRHA